MATEVAVSEQVQEKARGPVGEWLYRLKMRTPWFVAAALFRLIYKFKVVGEENFPHRGPFILNLNEYSLPAMLVSGWISIVMLERVMETAPDAIQSFMMEELWSFSFFSDIPTQGKSDIKPLMPQGAGRLALGLLDGVKVLQEGGMININSEGDSTWDGRPLRPGKALAWLALHTGAPIVPALASIGAYDIGPMWRPIPRLSGLMQLNIGKPFTLVDEPMMVVTPEDIEAANDRIFDEFNKVRFLPGTMEGWAGPPTRNGAPVGLPIELKPAHAPVIPWPDADKDHQKAWRRGVAQLLWRCPMCHTEVSLLHKYGYIGRKEKVRCRACGTRWTLLRIPHHDFRMKVQEGHPDMVGLDLPLSMWYDKAREGFELKPIEVSNVELRPAEEVYLAIDGVKFSAYKPSPLFDGLTSGEAPAFVAPGSRNYADHEVLGEGRLLVTSERLIWQGSEAEIYLEWPRFTAANMSMTTLYIRDGPAPSRFDVGQQIPLRIITYVGTLARRAAEADGHELQTMRF